HARDREVGADLGGEADVAAAAGLQVARLRLLGDRPDVGDREAPRLGEAHAQSFAHHGEARPMLGIRRRQLILAAGVDQLELEYRGGPPLRLSGGRKQGDQEGRQKRLTAAYHDVLPTPVSARDAVSRSVCQIGRDSNRKSSYY